MNLEFKNNHDFITLFEKRLQEYTGAPYVVLTDSCTHAIDLCLKFNKAFLPEKITIPKNTYISVAQTLHHNNIEVQYSDTKWEESYRLTPLKLFDCAVGFKQNMYNPGSIQCLSFQQKKALNIGRGGAILTDDKYLYEWAKRSSWDGRDASIPVELDDNLQDGYHYYMSPEDAARGILLLNQIDQKWIEHKLGSYNNYPDISKKI